MIVGPKQLQAGWIKRCLRAGLRKCLGAPAETLAIAIVPPLLTIAVGEPMLAFLLVPLQFAGAYWFVTPKGQAQPSTAALVVGQSLISWAVVFLILCLFSLYAIVDPASAAELSAELAGQSGSIESQTHELFGDISYLVILPWVYLSFLEFIISSIRARTPLYPPHLAVTMPFAVFAPFLRDRVGMPWRQACDMSGRAYRLNIQQLVMLIVPAVLLCEMYFLLPYAFAVVYAVYEEMFFGPTPEPVPKRVGVPAGVNA